MSLIGFLGKINFSFPIYELFILFDTHNQQSSRTGTQGLIGVNMKGHRHNSERVLPTRYSQNLFL